MTADLDAAVLARVKALAAAYYDNLQSSDAPSPISDKRDGAPAIPSSYPGKNIIPDPAPAPWDRENISRVKALGIRRNSNNIRLK